MSFAPEVRVMHEQQWSGNALRFATAEEATANVRDLSMRWSLVSATRVVESQDPVNYRWTEKGLEDLEGTVQPVVERTSD